MQHQAQRQKVYKLTKNIKRDGSHRVRLFFSRKAGLALLLAVMVLSTITNSGIGVFLGSTASAQSADAQERAAISAAWKARPVDQQIRIYQSYLALQSCFAGGLMKDGSGDNRINPANASKFQWFNEINVGSKANYTFIGDNIRNSQTDILGVKIPGSMVVCSNPNIIKTMLTTLGEDLSGSSSGGDMACALGFDRNKKGGSDGAGGGCGSDSPEGDFYRKGTIDSQLNKIRIRYENRFWGQGPYLTEAAQYFRYKSLFDTCASPSSDKTLKGTNRSYEIYVVGSDGKLSDEKQLYYGKENGGRARSEVTATGGGVAVLDGWNPGATLASLITSLPSGLPSSIANDKTIPTKMSCADLEAKLNDKNLAAKYIEYLASGATTPVLTPGAQDEICKQDPSADGCSNEGASSCVIEGIGWIVCPVVIFLSGVSDAAYGFLADNFLAVPVTFFDTSQPTFKAWQGFLSVANITLVIAFLFIVFSQLTGAGISNYGVKKLLPRLIIVAVMMNLSFFICQLAVDLSNILGYSLKTLLSSAGDGGSLLPVTDDPLATADNGLGMAGISLAILGGAGVGIAASGGITLALVALLGVLVTAVITLIVIFFILVIRQVLVVLLIVIAPLAFVAYLLPNTEQWFTRWRKIFTASLLLFPIIGIIFGASTLASKIIVGIYGVTDNYVGQAVGAGVMVLPLLVVPAVLKSALDILGKFGGKLSQLGDRANAGAKSRAGNLSFVKHAENMSADKKARIATGTYRKRGGNYNPANWRSSINRGLNNSRGFNMLTQGYGAQRDLGAQAQGRKDQKDAMDMFGGDDELVEAWALSGGDSSHAAFANLKEEGQRQQFMKMRAAGHHQKPTAHLAAIQYMSEQGKGSSDAVISALGHASRGGANATDISNTYKTAIASYRNSGRGDIMGQLEAEKNAAGGQIPMDVNTLSATKPDIEKESVKAWQSISASKVHRMGVEASKNPEGYESYKKSLESDQEYTRRALAGYDDMETRAQNEALPAILAAAAKHTGVTITGVEHAKTLFGVKK